MKKLVWLISFFILIFIWTTFASTWTNVILTTSTYNGLLSDYLNTQKTTLKTFFNTTYQNLYSEFSKTWLAIMKTLDYQSLVCLGTMKDIPLLSQMQKEKISLQSAMLKDFIDLDLQISTLEEKYNIQKNSDVSLFDIWSTYESEKAKLKIQIDDLFQTYKTSIQSFETNYKLKIKSFVTDYNQYTTQNKDLIKSINDRILKIQTVISWFNSLDALAYQLNNLLGWASDYSSKIESLKYAGIGLLSNQIQSVINSQITKYPKLTLLSGDLVWQKESILNSYKTEMNSYLDTLFQKRYDRSKYNIIKDKIQKLQAKYYINNNKFNCINILWSIDDTTNILTEINIMKANINSWILLAKGGTWSVVFQTEILNGFKNLYTTKLNQKLTDFQNFARKRVAQLLQNTTDNLDSRIDNIANLISGNTWSSNNLNTWSNNLNTWNTIPVQIKTWTTLNIKPWFQFTKPFTNNQKNSEIATLQQLLKNLKFYNGAINSIYDKATINAVYAFQKANWLLRGYEKKPQTRWWMWPATRKALNKLIGR